MVQQNERKLTNSHKRLGWLAAAVGLLFVALYVSIALLASILKNHVSSDKDVIALVPVEPVVNEAGVSEADMPAGQGGEQEKGPFSSKVEPGEGEAVNGAAAGKSGMQEGQPGLWYGDTQEVREESVAPVMKTELTSEDVLVAIPLDPGIEVYDDVRTWETDTRVDIFRISYENEEAVVSVDGGDDKVIAPGTNNTYTFYLKNTGDVDLDYTLNLEAYFTPQNLQIPIEVKLKGYDGTYLVGSQDTWGKVSELNNAEDKAAIDVNCYAYYTLEWQWPYESGEDAFDTYLGNRAVDEDLTLTIGIKTVATGEDYKTAVHKIFISSLVPGNPKTGDELNILLWMGSMTASVLVLSICLFGKKRRKTNSFEESGRD